MTADFTLRNAAEDRTTGANFDYAGSDDEALLHTPDLVVSPTNSWIVGFAFRADDTTNLATGLVAPHIAFRNTDGEQCRIELYEFVPTSTKPGGLLYFGWKLMRGTTEIARTDQVFVASLIDDRTWTYFQFKVTIDNSAGSIEGNFRYLKTTRNPTTGFETFTWDNTVTSLDTQEQTSTGADSMVISFDTGTIGDRVAYDDLYLCDSTGSKNNDYLGRCFVSPQKITTTSGGDGDTADWALVTATDTEDAWQETTLVTENDDRLTSDVTSQIHLAQMGGANAFGDMDDATIIGVRLDLHARMETTGSLSMGFMWRKTTATAAQIEFGTAFTVSSTTMTANVAIAENDPNTLTDWVFADLDTIQMGAINKG